MLRHLIQVVAATDGQMPQTREHLLLAKQVGVDHLVCYINKADAVDKEMLDLVEMEMREVVFFFFLVFFFFFWFILRGFISCVRFGQVLTQYGYDGDNLPVIIGSALCALNDTNPELGEQSIVKLMDAVDNHIPTPKRELDKPFLMSIEDVFSIAGRGTVVTGRVERGVVNKGDEVDIIGYGSDMHTTVTGVEMVERRAKRPPFY